ncbi:MAG: dTMP kinase [Candidatus Kaelpia aquatica]|nr:dTMP kinase [Candidatus Kaelpia aquatica]
MKGTFVTFEGIEGSGKSTQAGLFINWCQENGKKVLFLREPGSTSIGEKIREVLLSLDYKNFYPQTELLLFLSARAQMVREKIRPALEEGVIVILDRYLDSTFAYQGYGEDIPLDLIDKMNSFATSNLMPDITFLLDIEIGEGLKRAGFKDRIEKKGLKFHSKVRDGYNRLVESSNGRMHVVKVKEDSLETQKEIREIFQKKFFYKFL